MSSVRPAAVVVIVVSVASSLPLALSLLTTPPPFHVRHVPQQSTRTRKSDSPCNVKPPSLVWSSSRRSTLLPLQQQNLFVRNRDRHASTTTTSLQAGIITGSAISSSSSSWLASWLPVCTDTTVYQVALVSGCIGLASQLVLTKLLQTVTSTSLSTSTNSVLDNNAAYTAHSMVALGLMILVSIVGVVGWWCQPLPASAAGRLIQPLAAARWLAAVISGMFIAWDVPTSLVVKKLRKPDVVVHHIVMAVIAWMGATTLPMHYIFFYLGISELSSIPLIVYDQLAVMTERDPSLTDNDDNDDNTTTTDPAIVAMYKSLVKWRDTVFQPLAAVAFTWIRAILFTKVTLWHFVPDVLHVLSTLSTSNHHPLARPLRFLLVSSIGFTALQLFWFSQIVRIVILGARDNDKDNTNKDNIKAP